jgi:hypothetical protein
MTVVVMTVVTAETVMTAVTAVPPVTVDVFLKYLPL